MRRSNEHEEIADDLNKLSTWRLGKLLATKLGSRGIRLEVEFAHR
jgi:hypothetical protein